MCQSFVPSNLKIPIGILGNPSYRSYDVSWMQKFEAIIRVFMNLSKTRGDIEKTWDHCDKIMEQSIRMLFPIIVAASVRPEYGRYTYWRTWAAKLIFCCEPVICRPCCRLYLRLFSRSLGKLRRYGSKTRFTNMRFTIVKSQLLFNIPTPSRNFENCKWFAFHWVKEPYFTKYTISNTHTYRKATSWEQIKYQSKYCKVS